MIHPELYPCLSIGQKQIVGVAILVMMLIMIAMRKIAMRKIAKRKLKANRSKRHNAKRNNEKYYLDFIIDSKNKTLQEIQEERAQMIKMLKEIGYYA